MKSRPQTAQLSFACLVAVGSMLQFLVMVPLAALAYPDPEGYSFTQQFLSELGCVSTSDHLHAFLFNISLAVFGCGLCYLFGLIVKAASDGPVELLVVAECGFGAAVSLILVALLPYDVFPHGHTVAMITWLMLMIPMFMGWMEWVRHMPGRSAIFLLFGRSLQLVVVSFPIVAMLHYGPLFQKVVVVLSIVWLSVFCLHFMKAIRNNLIPFGVKRWY